jgi:HNH endonuclease
MLEFGTNYPLVYHSHSPGHHGISVLRTVTSTNGRGFTFRGAKMKLRYKREPVNDDRRRCRYCQNILRGHPTKRNCNLCLGWLSFGWRKAIAKRDDHTCAYCNEKVDAFHIDHIHPRSKGGKNTAENLVTSCAVCNLAKSDNQLDPDTRGRVVAAVQKRNKKHKIADDMYFPADYGKPKR